MPAIDDRLKHLGITLPMPVPPVANYVPFVISKGQLVISGQICAGLDGKIAERHLGKLGGAVSMEAGKEAARFAAINVLAQAKAALGNLDRISRCVRLGGFINSAPDFAPLPQVMNGASDLMVEVFGEKGRHARSTIGVANLPLNCAVEVEALFELS
jgi:enamine deaminase RidA (YjgF/YER057c/UK114 family)